MSGLLFINNNNGFVKILHLVRVAPEGSALGVQFFDHCDVPYVRRNNRKIARLQDEAFCLSIEVCAFYAAIKMMAAKIE
jgi:hypothetical protein